MLPLFPTFYDYWAKYDAKTDVIHRLPYHNLDVGTVLEGILHHRPHVVRKVAEITGLHSDLVIPLCTVNGALHDIGKHGYFQDRLYSVSRRLCLERGVIQDSRDPLNPEAGYYHTDIGWYYWEDFLADAAQQQIKITVDGAPPIRSTGFHRVMDPLLLSTIGHHGTPPRHVPCENIREGTQQDVVDFHKSLLELYGLHELEFHSRNTRGLKQASWILAGLIIPADWLGSNEELFPFCSEKIPLQDYRDESRKKAQVALRSVGMIPPKVRKYRGISHLFGFIQRPTDLQRTVAKMPLGKGPQLFAFQESTGGGKSAASFILTHRMISEGIALGSYTALPSQASGNNQYRTIRKYHLSKKMFEGGTDVLVHGDKSMWLRQHKDELQDFDSLSPHQEWRENSSVAQRNAWFCNRNKAAMFTDMGAGTVDQPILGMLPVRHAPMRMVGLMGKVLTIDEVHCYDSYVIEMLEALIEQHTFLGGSTILMSATLPEAIQSRLYAAFFRGAGKTPETIPLSQAYPLITHLRSDGVDVTHYPVDPRPECVRDIGIEFHHKTEEAEEAILEAADKGACVCWIRNTVRDARDSYRRLMRRRNRHKILLFHSRYTVYDRAQIEDIITRKFGEDSLKCDRGGWIVIATQVVEQSLDLDFDVLFTDLAPMDMILQRAGRMCRHPRNLLDHAVKKVGMDERGPPTLHIVAPVWEEDPSPEWIPRFGWKTHFIYRDHGILWRTMQMLLSRDNVSIPGDYRELIEGVYGKNAYVIPEGLAEAHRRALNESSRNQGRARQNLLKISGGYKTNKEWVSDDRPPTRINFSNTRIRLGKLQNGEVVPLHGEKGDDLAWENSTVSVPDYTVCGRLDAHDAEICAAELEMRDKGLYTVLLLVEACGEGWRGRCLKPSRNGNKIVEFHYDADVGFE